MLPFLTQGLLGDRQHPLSRSFLVALAFKAARIRSGLQSAGDHGMDMVSSYICHPELPFSSCTYFANGGFNYSSLTRFEFERRLTKEFAIVFLPLLITG